MARTSRETFLTDAAADPITLTPDASLPVNATLSTPGCDESAAPTAVCRSERRRARSRTASHDASAASAAIGAIEVHARQREFYAHTSGDERPCLASTTEPIV